MLVVITDANPTGSDLVEKRASFALQDKGVKIITVVMGTDVDPRELQKITTFKENSLVDDSKDSPTQLGERIVNTAATRMCFLFLWSKTLIIVGAVLTNQISPAFRYHCRVSGKPAILLLLG